MKESSRGTQHFGPFLVRVVPQPDGWNRYALVVDEVELEAWLSSPGISYCCDAVLRAMGDRRLEVRRGVELLLAVDSKPTWPASLTLETEGVA